MKRRLGLVERAQALLRQEIVRYGLVGLVNSAFGYTLFILLQLTLGRFVHYTVVLTVSTVLAILEAYVLQRWLVFRYTGGWWASLLRFSSVYGVAYLINLALLTLFVETFALDPIPAQGIAMVLQALVTYGANRTFTFRRRGDRATGGDAGPGRERTAATPTREALS